MCPGFGGCGTVEKASPRCREAAFSEDELRHNGVLGSSLSRGAARRRPRVRYEAPEDGIADAPLEAAQRLLAGLALSDLLAVVGTASNLRAGLAGGDHVQGVVEVSVARQREPVAHHLSARCLHRGRA